MMTDCALMGPFPEVSSVKGRVEKSHDVVVRGNERLRPGQPVRHNGAS